jgi:hypothetical protein
MARISAPIVPERGAMSSWTEVAVVMVSSQRIGGGLILTKSLGFVK